MNFIPMSRRRALKLAGCGFGYVALAGLLDQWARAEVSRNPLAPKPAQFTPKAKRVIFLFMHGGPSHVDTFDPKPLLQRDTGNSLPASLRVKGVDPNGKLL